MRTLLMLCGLIAAALLTLASCRDSPLDASLAEVVSPASAGSMAPRLSTGGDGRVYLSWLQEIGGDDVVALMWARWEEGSWSDPGTVGTGSDWFVNWADVPSVSAFADGTMFAHWLQMNGDLPYAYAVRTARSADSGSTWSAVTTLHDDESAAEHGFVSFVPKPGGPAALFWLDGRDAGAHGGTGATQLLSRTMNADGSRSEERVVDERVCDCCQTSAAWLDDGHVVVAYRDRSLDEVRDIGVATVGPDGPPRARAFPSDGWRIAGCPVNGPAVASDGGRVGIAWFTLGADERPRVFATLARDGTEIHGEPIEVAGSTAPGGPTPLGRVGVAFGARGALWVSYIEKEGGQAFVTLRRVDPDGSIGETTRLARTSPTRASGFPQIARAPDGLLVAWTDPGKPPRVMTAIVR